MQEGGNHHAQQVHNARVEDRWGGKPPLNQRHATTSAWASIKRKVCQETEPRISGVVNPRSARRESHQAQKSRQQACKAMRGGMAQGKNVSDDPRGPNIPTKTTLEKQHERRRRCHAARAKSSQCPQDATMMRGPSRRGWKGLAACGDRGGLENAWWLGVDDGTA